MKKITGIILGALLVAVGVIYILGAFGIADINISLDGWWTLFIIVPCLNGLFTDKDKTGSIIGLAVGVMLLLAAQDVIEYSMVLKLIVPVIVIVIGIKMIGKAVGCKDARAAAKISAIFGGTECNLTDTEIKDGSQVDLICVFGGADIIVPENVKVKVNAFCLFGGISDEREIKNTTENAVTLNINGFCIFGGADIK